MKFNQCTRKTCFGVKRKFFLQSRGYDLSKDLMCLFAWYIVKHINTSIYTLNLNSVPIAYDL